MNAPNLLADLPDASAGEVIEMLIRSANVRIERIVSQGQASPEGFWYDQEIAELVVVISGAARVRFEGREPIELCAGAYLNIPAHARHRVEWTDPDRPTVWLAVHYR